jgi:oligopeptide/dipeptide ABC transporter ATP-binding protein
MIDQPILEIAGLRVEFAPRGRPWPFGPQARPVVALRNISLSVKRGEILGIIGESGSGKSTLANAILRVAPIARGTLRYGGADITRLSRRDLRPFRAKMQMIFQDSHSALNPRKTVATTLMTTLKARRLTRASLRRETHDLLQTVGLRPMLAERYPHELSGGQRQRVGIARALAMHPEFLIADEPVSALDVSLQGQILNLLLGLHKERKLTIILISHDLAVVKHVSSRVAVMYAGSIVEFGAVDDVVERPLHPYTQLLIASVPQGLAGKQRYADLVRGELETAAQLQHGCPFADRCPSAMPTCVEIEPTLCETQDGHAVACHLYPSVC